MGLFDVLNKVNTTVQKAVNEYKEDQERKETEKKLMESIYKDICDYVESHLDVLDWYIMENLLDLEILCYDSFKKENYVDGYDILCALAYARTEENAINEKILFECFEGDENRKQVISAIEGFYKKFFYDAFKTEWYCNYMLPFYKEDAIKELAFYLNHVLHCFLAEKTLSMCKNRYETNVNDILYELLIDKKFDFGNPVVAFALNAAEDDDLEKNLNHYEKECFERYKRLTIFFLLKKYGLKKEGQKPKHVYLYDDNVACFVGVVNNMFCYLPIEYKNVKKIEQLSYIANDKPIMIPFAELLYWKQDGEYRKELGIKEPNAVVAMYAATKGVVAPRRLEEKEIDTRCIILVTKTKQIKFSFDSMQVFEDLLPQYQYDRVLFERGNT